MARHPQYDPAAARRLDHAARRFQAGGDGLLHLHVLPGAGADFDGLQAEIGEGAHVHVVHPRMAAHILVRRHELRPVLLRERAPGRLVNVGADGQFESDVAIDPRVQPRDRAGADHSDSHRNTILSKPDPSVIAAPRRALPATMRFHA